MKGGPSNQGNITQTTVNPTQNAQLPFLKTGWGAAEDLYQNSPYSYYPGQTLATPNFWLPTGYNELAAAGANAGSMLPQATDQLNYFTAGGGGIQNSPAAVGLSNIAYGGNPFLTQAGAFTSGLSGVGNAAMANPYVKLLESIQQQAGGPDYGRDQLQKTASGMYLNSNPYVDEMYDAASSAVTRAYQTATAPQADSNYATAGRYGSGVLANARSQNQQDLGGTLGNLSANIYGGNYQAERGRQDAASQALATLIAQNYALQGNLASGAGSLYNQGLGIASDSMARGGALDIQALAAQQAALNTIQGGYQTGNQQQIQALSMFPAMLQAQFAPSQAMIQAGQGLTGLDQQVLSDAEKRFYGEQNAPWDELSKYMSAIGQPTSGSSSVTSPLLGPNPLSSALSTGTSALGLFNGLSSAGLFGGGSAAIGAPIVSSLGSWSPLAAGAASAAPAAWIICTELVKQGRLPRKWWAVGAKVFNAYPEIAKRGYYVWAIPSVRHLRRKPNSLYSRLLAKVFHWRAEDIAARRGIKGARKLWRGRAVTVTLALPCLVLGALAKEQDWQSVYREETV